MSLFFGRRGEQRSTWVDFGGTSWEVGGRAPVDEDNAPKLAPVFAAQRHIVDFISTLPLDAYRKEDTGARTPIALPGLFTAADAEGGPGLVTWLGQAALGLANGNAVGWITQVDGYGFPASVRWLHWSHWSFNEDTKQWWVLGEQVPASRIVHIPWMVPPGKTLGLSPIEYFAATVRAGLSAQEYSDIKRGGGVPPTVLKNVAKTIDSDQARTVKKRAAESFAKGEPFVTGNDWDLTPVAIPPNQAQFAETLKLTANLVAAIYGLDPVEVAGTPGGSLTYNTEELRQIKRAADMRPYIVRLERAFFRHLPNRQYVQFNIDATMRVDLTTRVTAVGAQIQDGRMSVNEARALEDRPPVPGGDYHNVPAPTKPAVPNMREGEAS